jgi:Spherulation-specific family 4
MLKSLVSNPSRARRALFGVIALLIGGGVQTTLLLRSNAVAAFRVGVETFTYGDAEWKQLTETGSKVGPVIISPSTGPGLEQNSDVLDRVQRSQEAGQTVYGFIDVSGPKTQALVVAEANRYKTFYDVDGIYLAGISTAATCGPSDYLTLVTADIRTNVGINKIGINAYGEPNSCVQSIVDLVHIPFDSPTSYATYAALPSWTTALATGSTLQIWHSVRTTATAAEITTVKATAQTTSSSFLSTADGTASVPLAPTSAYWTQMVSTVAGTYTATPLSVGTVLTQKFAMPTYFNDDQWATLAAIGPQFSMAIVNPSSGPGTSKIPAIAAQVLAAQAQGVKVIGYVSTNYHGLPAVVGNPHVPPYDVNTAVANYLSWYGVDGIFFDEAVYECNQTSFLAGYVQALRAAKSGALAAVNPGRNSGECLVAPTSGVGTVPGAVGADVSVNFEGSAATYETWQPSFWTRKYPAEKFWHIVFSAPAGNPMEHVVDLAKMRQGGLLFATDTSALSGGTAFSILPTYLDALRSKIYGSVVNGTTTTTTSTTSTTSTTTTTTTTTSTTTSTTVAPTTTKTEATTTTTTPTSTTTPTTTTTTTTTTAAPAPAPTPTPAPTTTPATTTLTTTTTTTAAPSVFAPFQSGGGGGVTITNSGSTANNSAASTTSTAAPTFPPTTQAPIAATPVQNLQIVTTTAPAIPTTSTAPIPTTTKPAAVTLSYSSCGINKATTTVNGIAGLKGSFRLRTTITCTQKPGLPATFISVSKVDLPSALAPGTLKTLAAKVKDSTKNMQGTTKGSVSTVQVKKTLTVTFKGTGNPTTENILRSLAPALNG